MATAERWKNHAFGMGSRGDTPPTMWVLQSAVRRYIGTIEKSAA